MVAADLRRVQIALDAHSTVTTVQVVAAPPIEEDEANVALVAVDASNQPLTHHSSSTKIRSK